MDFMQEMFQPFNKALDNAERDLNATKQMLQVMLDAFESPEREVLPEDPEAANPERDECDEADPTFPHEESATV